MDFFKGNYGSDEEDDLLSSGSEIESEIGSDEEDLDVYSSDDDVFPILPQQSTYGVTPFQQSTYGVTPVQPGYSTIDRDETLSSGSEVREPYNPTIQQSYNRPPVQPMPQQSYNRQPVQPMPQQSYNRPPVQPMPQQSRPSVQPMPQQSYNRQPVQPMPQQSTYGVTPLQPMPQQSTYGVTPLQPMPQQSTYGVTPLQPIQQGTGYVLIDIFSPFGMTKRPGSTINYDEEQNSEVSGYPEEDLTQYNIPKKKGLTYYDDLQNAFRLKHGNIYTNTLDMLAKCYVNAIELGCKYPTEIQGFV